MQNRENDIVLFMDENIQLEVPVSQDGESVWLSANQMAVLFDKDETNIRKHINNIFKSSEVDKNNNTQKMRVDGVKQSVAFYSLDVILAVGYRVNSKRGIAFRKWANNVLKQYIMKGYALNERRLQALRKTVDIQTRMLADALDIEEKDVLRAVNEYTEALLLLDQYDHQTLCKPDGSAPIYRITYDECTRMVGRMKDSFHTDVFGVEKEAGKVAGIIAAIYQSVFGQDAYPSVEEKAANLLYFMIKDHPYADGCKRIAASLFLEFLDKNNVLFLDGEKRLSDGTLVAITLMIAESKPEEKDVMDRLDSAFRNCEKLQNHVRLLLDKGGLYKTYNGNLLFHGSIPLNEDGSLKEVQIYGKTYRGKELYDVLETYVRRAFFSVNEDEKRKGRDIMWYIWAAPNSPLFGKDKMTTFERYFIKDKETHKETKNAYYHLLENEEVVDNLLREFGLDPEKGHIINGHVPVHQSEGESPVKCNGKVLVIDGGFSRPYQKVTGIAGYTLVYNSYGLILSAHEPFTSAEEAVAKEQDIVSNRVAVHYNNKRTLVGDTDTGAALKERISELIQLLEAYRKGIIKEKK